MQVVLVQPPHTSDPLDEGAVPLGLLSIGSVLAQRGDQVKILDLQKVVQHYDRPLDDSFYGLACDMVLSLQPDVVGFTAMSVSLPTAVLIAEELRKREPGLRIVFGGPQPTLSAEPLIAAFPCITVVVRGEGEVTIKELMDTFENSGSLTDVMGITFRGPQGVISTPDRNLIDDLDSLPLLRWDLLDDLEYYSRPKKGIYDLPLDAGRGCPWHCTFCATSLMWRRRFRLKSVPRLLREMQSLHDTYGIRGFTLQHDMFTANREQLTKFCESLIDSGQHFHWGCSSRVDRLDEDLLALMRRAECHGIFLGIESGSPSIQKRIGKNLDLSHARNIIKICADLNIPATASFILGFPGETEDELNQTLELAIHSKAIGASNIQLHVLIPETGTAIAKAEREHFVLDEHYLRQSNTFVIPSGTREVALVKQYPDLFAAFYNIQVANLSIPLLYELATSFRLLMYLYPRLLWLLCVSTGMRPLDLWRSFKRHGGLESQDFAVTDLETLYQHFSPFARMLVSGISGTEHQLLEDLLEFEDTGAAFRAGVAKQSVQDPPPSLDGGYYFVANSTLLATRSDIPRVLRGIRAGESLTELAADPTPGTVLFMGSGQRSRSVVGLSALKAFLLQHISHGVRTEAALRAAVSTRWPSIDLDQLALAVNRTLSALVNEDILSQSGQKPAETMVSGRKQVG